MGNEENDNMSGLAYRLLYGITYLHALLPFSLLYLLSDFLFFMVYHVVRYRRKLVRKNLKNAFPEKSDKSLIKLEKKFYHHLCDYYVETIKTLRISDEDIHKRMRFVNPELINRLTDQGKSCILSLGHYGNWEWVPAIVTYFRPGVEQGLVYKRLHSAAFDRLFLKIRSRFNSLPFEMRSVFRQMIRLQDEGKIMVVGFLNDQRPSPRQEKYWTTFLNQDTPVQTGMEKIAHRLGCSVIYLDIEKVKRGYYRGKFFVISPDAAEEEPNVITERYMRKLEETVLREPSLYLWSHNRWKFRKADLSYSVNEKKGHRD